MQNATLWNNYMAAYDFLTNVESYNENLRTIAASTGPLPQKRVLDAGSGTGNLSLILKSGGAHVTSCDFSESALALHQKKDRDATLVKLSLEEKLPFPNESFDAVCCASVLFTLSESGCRNAVSEFFRILKPGGRLVVTVPAVQARPASLIGLYLSGLISKYGRVCGAIAAVRHLPSLALVVRYAHKLRSLPSWGGFHIFDEQELAALINGAGFNHPAVDLTYGNCFFKAVGLKSEANHADLSQPAAVGTLRCNERQIYESPYSP